MSGEKLRASIIIVSETASKDPSTDKCIPALREVFDTDGGGRFDTSDTAIVPDDVLSIQRAITERTDGPEPANLIVTSGGTGFTTKDVTPEVGTRHIRERPTRSARILFLDIDTNDVLGSLTTHTQACVWPCVSQVPVPI